MPGMTSNPKASAWHSPTQEQRIRKKVGFTLSDEARAKLERLSRARKVTKSELVELLIMEAP